jgi:predicted dehydrogenase
MHHDRTDAEDNAVLLMRFEGGQLAIAETSWTARGGLDLRNEVYGTDGAIFTDVTRETGIRVFALKGAGYIVNCVLDAAYRSMETKRWERVDYD